MPILFAFAVPSFVLNHSPGSLAPNCPLGIATAHTALLPVILGDEPSHCFVLKRAARMLWRAIKWLTQRSTHSFCFLMLCCVVSPSPLLLLPLRCAVDPPSKPLTPPWSGRVPLSPILPGVTPSSWFMIVFSKLWVGREAECEVHLRRPNRNSPASHRYSSR